MAEKERRKQGASSDPESALPGGQIVIYQDGTTRLQVRIEGRTVWLPQRLIAELYQVSVPTVNDQLANIYGERELDPQATIRSFRIVQREEARGRWAAEWRESLTLPPLMPILYVSTPRRISPPGLRRGSAFEGLCGRAAATDGRAGRAR